MDFILSTCKGVFIYVINIIINLSTVLSSGVYYIVDNYQKVRFNISAGSRYSSPFLWEIPSFLSTSSTVPVDFSTTSGQFADRLVCNQDALENLSPSGAPFLFS